MPYLYRFVHCHKFEFQVLARLDAHNLAPLKYEIVITFQVELDPNFNSRRKYFNHFDIVVLKTEMDEFLYLIIEYM